MARTGLLGGKQLGFGAYEQTIAKKQTKRERFLAEMDVVVPWKAPTALFEPHEPKDRLQKQPPAFYPLAT